MGKKGTVDLTPELRAAMAAMAERLKSPSWDHLRRFGEMLGLPPLPTDHLPQFAEKYGLSRIAETLSETAPKAKLEKKPGPQVSRAIAILIELYPPTGIPTVRVGAAHAAVNKKLGRTELPIGRDSVRRAVLVLKKRNAP